MLHLSDQTQLILAALVYTPVVIMHLTKRNRAAVSLYILQSSAIALLLISSLFDKFSLLLLLAISATVAVKIFVAPYFFNNLTRRHRLRFSVSTYLNTPLSLLVIAALFSLSQSSFLAALVFMPESSDRLLRLAFASMLTSLFLCINRKGALSQMLGILSLENSIVAFALFAGLEQSPGLQLGITFNILIWVIIATVFASMIFRKFGSLDVTAMKRLKG